MYILFEIIKWIAILLVGIHVVKASSKRQLGIMAFVLLTAVSLACGYVLSYAVNATVFENMASGNIIAAYSELVGMLLIYAVVLAVKRKTIMIIEPVLSIILALVVLNKLHEDDYSFGALLYVIAIVLVALNVYMYYMMTVDPDTKLAAQKKELMDMHADDLKLLYEQISEEHKTITGREHEYKNTIAYINALAQKGDYDSLKDYLAKEQNTLEKNTSIVDTGNKVISTVFNAKYSEARRHGIKVRFVMNNLSGLNYDDRDLVILISNLFNNAIEACDKLDEKDRLIKISMNNTSSGFCLSFSNPCNEQWDKTITTTKEDKTIHGFGLKNINEIAERYGGFADIENKDEWFTIRVMLM